MSRVKLTVLSEASAPSLVAAVLPAFEASAGIPAEDARRLDAVVEEFASRVTGTSGSHQRVKPDDLLKIGCIVPASECVQRFTDAVSPILAKVHSNLEQSGTLAALRDALLPKLLSGEIRVKDAKKLAEEN